MLSADVFKLYENPKTRRVNRAAIARDLGINRQAVHNWKRLVPPLQAARLAQIHPEKLRFDPDDYSRRRRKRRAA